MLKQVKSWLKEWFRDILIMIGLILMLSAISQPFLTYDNVRGEIRNVR